ncbi:MAG: protein kinase [Anaerolineae bacterium]|nr:protein kinase [Anaerolineae bacterium]
MSEVLQIQTLGGLAIECDGQPVTGFDSRKVQALLVYLACTGRTHPREVLAEMLWEERGQAQSLANLRVALTSLRQTVGPFVSITRETVSIDPTSDVWLDAAVFEDQVDAAGSDVARLLDAIDLYQGDFLAGFYVDSTLFEEWATRERERLRLRGMDALDTLITSYLDQGDYQAGIARATQILDMDPLREETHRQLMELLWYSGQRGKALEQYDICRQLLAEELGVAPTTATTALYDRIQAGETPGAPQPTGIRGYVIRERIGQGSFGEVYRAFQPIGQAGREVAIKVIKPEYANQPDFIRRFEVEAQLIARLEHQNIVPLYDYWREPGGAYLVMRLLPDNLHARLRRGPLTVTACVRLVEQVAAALMTAHTQGVIHRDLKPANLLLDDEGNAYLTDFGIAKVLGPALHATQAGVLVGSPGYLSPEQIRSEPVTCQSDLYSFGVLLYEALTGTSPFPPSLTPAALLQKHLAEPLPSLLAACPDLPPALEGVLRQATAKDPAQRFQTALELAAAFREAAGPAGLRQPPGQVVTPAAAGMPDVRTWTPADSLVGQRNPYKGLNAFLEADADDFFGREALVDHLLACLADDHPLARFLAVVGPSGCGKSSVVRAGLIPALRAGRVAGAEDWFIAGLLPGAHPLEEIELALLRIAPEHIPTLLPMLRENERGLLRAVRRVLPKEATLLLVIDQFEEVFTLVEDPVEARFFMESLYAAATDPRSPLRVIITLRADFYDRPLMHPHFSQLVRQRTEAIVPMTAEEVERAVSLPAESVHVALEPGLTAAITADIHQQPGALPMLQYALTELFDRRSDHLLTLDAYQAIGGVQGALARRADEVYRDLPLDQQHSARQLFLRLVTLGEGVEDTRRRTLQSELLSVGGDTMQAVIHVFDRARLLTLDRDPITRGPTVEVAHEALLREWGQLRAWLDESRHAIRQQRLLAAAAEEWLHAGKDPSYLLRGSRLEQFAGWAAETDVALTAEEHEFLDVSVTNEERARARRRRVRNGVLVAAILIAILMTGLSLIALDRENQAQDARATSDYNAQMAAANAAEAQELALVNGARAALVGGDTETALALAVAANRTENPSGQAQVILSETAYQPGVIRVFEGHQGWVWWAEFSPDGNTILTSADDEMRLWDLKTGETLLRFGPGTATYAFSPDGQTLLTTTFEETSITLWDLSTGEVIRHFTSDETLGTFNPSMAFTPDGRTFLSGNGGGWPFSEGDSKLLLWDVETGEIIRTFEGHSGYTVLQVVISPDGRRALSGTAKNELILWDVETGAIIHRFEADGDEWWQGPSDLAFSPDGRTALSKSWDGSMILWDLETFEKVTYDTQYAEGDWFPSRVAFSPDGRTAITGGDDATIWDLDTGELITTLPGVANGVGFSPDGRTALTAGESAARLWDLQNGAAIRRIASGYGLYAISPDERYFLDAVKIPEPDGGMTCWMILSDLATGEEIRRFGPIARQYGSELAQGACAPWEMVFSPDGRMILSGGEDSRATLWDVETGQLVRVFSGNAGMISSVAFSPDGRSALTAGADGMVILWDVATGEEIHRLFGHRQEVWEVAISPDGRTALSGSQDTTVILWDLATGAMIHRLEGHTGAVNGLAVSPDGRTAVSGGDDGLEIVWDLATGEQLNTFIGHKGAVAVKGIAFSPDGQTVFSGGADAIIQWELVTGEAIRRYPPGFDFVFSPDGRSFFASWDGTIYEYRIDSLDELRAWTLANRHVRELTCTERALYSLEPGCDAAGLFPTSTPYLTVQPAATATLTPTVDFAHATATLTATTTPTILPRPILTAQVGEQRGEVAIGNNQVWAYKGYAGEVLTIRVSADNPVNGFVPSEEEPLPDGMLDTVVIVTAPDGVDMNARGYLPARFDPPESNDIEPDVNTDSLIEGLVLPVNGTYRIEVSGLQYQTGGSYTLTIESQLPDAVTPPPDS